MVYNWVKTGGDTGVVNPFGNFYILVASILVSFELRIDVEEFFQYWFFEMEAYFVHLCREFSEWDYGEFRERDLVNEVEFIGPDIGFSEDEVGDFWVCFTIDVFHGTDNPVREVWVQFVDIFRFIHARMFVLDLDDIGWDTFGGGYFAAYF